MEENSFGGKGGDYLISLTLTKYLMMIVELTVILEGPF